MESILQWNIRGIRSNLEELNLLLANQIAVIALQETLLTSDSFSLTNYNSIHCPVSKTVPSRGVSLFIRKDLLFQTISVNSPLEVVAARIAFNKSITVASIYLSPSVNINKNSLLEVIDQLPRPFLILGDFNAKSPLWGSDILDSRGKIIEDILSDMDLCILNTGSPTFISSSYSTGSHIDLSVCDPSLFLDFSWRTNDDLCGSDHFPIFLSFKQTSKEHYPKFWKFKNTNWSFYNKSCFSALQKDFNLEIEDPAVAFSNIIIEIANKIIPKTSNKPHPPKNPWFDDECKQLINERKKAQRKLFSQPTVENVITFKKIKAKCRLTFKKKKKLSWRTFCSSLNFKTNSKKVWRVVNKLKNKSTNSTAQCLKRDNEIITNKKEIANILADTISKNSSSDHYSTDFQKIKAVKERNPCNFKSDNSECYNESFSLMELKDALLKCNNSAPGPDDIHYQLLTHLSDPSLEILLNIFNKIWSSGTFPISWREANIIPIPKPGKDASDPNNYRPIALTSCLCKTMERMVYERLLWQLEMSGALSSFQCGFRKNRSTADHLVRFETFIRNAFINNEQVVAVLFDLEKAYDTTWKHGILLDLQELGFKGNLPTFISNFLSDRIFKVRIGTTLSDLHKQEMGVPQGSILSPLLFNIKINKIVNSTKQTIDKSLFVDDFAVCAKGKNLNSIERQLQLSINAIQKWVSENGFKFSSSKTECIHFHRKRGLQKAPDLKLDNVNIKVTDKVKFLGIYFDSKLTFLPHIKYLRTACFKKLNLIKVVSHTNWGADKKTLLCLYRSLVRSKLDYGCFIYGSARRSYLKALDPIHHQALRLCLGAFRTSPKESLYVEANEPPLELRRLKLGLNYYIKLRANPDNPAYDCVINPEYKDKFLSKPSEIPSFGLRTLSHLKSANIETKNISDDPLYTTLPPWNIEIPIIDFSLTSYGKETTSPTVFKHLFSELCNKYFGYSKLFTDGSLQNNRVAAATVSGPMFLNQTCQRLPDDCSIFTAELYGILLALRQIAKSKEREFIIFSDSLSVLQTLNKHKISHPFIADILELYNSLINKQNKKIVLAWIPSHVGIKGNEVVDMAAKKALKLPVSKNIFIPFTDLKKKVNDYVGNQWIRSWSKQINNKLFHIVPDLSKRLPCYTSNRKTDTILTRLRIGHTLFSHSFLLNKTDPPWCSPCDSLLSVKHILLDCPELGRHRRRFYNVFTLKELFEAVPVLNILKFLSHVGFISKI